MSTQVGRVRVTDKLTYFASANQAAMDRALSDAGVDILRLSKMQVPHDTGNLQSSGRLERKGLMHFEVSYNASGVAPYARRWEYKTPPHGFKGGRKSQYLRDPGEEITRESNMVHLFKQAAKRIKI